MDIYDSSSDKSVEDITAESIVNDLIRRKEDDVRYLKASINDATQWLASSEKALLLAEKELDVLRTMV